MAARLRLAGVAPLDGEEGRFSAAAHTAFAALLRSDLPSLLLARPPSRSLLSHPPPQSHPSGSRLGDEEEMAEVDILADVADPGAIPDDAVTTVSSVLFNAGLVRAVPHDRYEWE